MRHNGAKQKGEFMDFYADAVTLLEALARALYVPDFFAGLFMEERQGKISREGKGSGNLASEG